jgi:hypothetical protein
MADEEQLRILKQGVETWNAWREQAGVETPIDLSEANFSGADFPSYSIAGRSSAGEGQSVAPASDSSRDRRLPTRRTISANGMQSGSMNPPRIRKLSLTPDHGRRKHRADDWGE